MKKKKKIWLFFLIIGVCALVYFLVDWGDEPQRDKTAADWYDVENEYHEEITPDKLTYTGVDEAGIGAAIDKLIADIETDDTKQVLDDYDTIISSIDDFDTQVTLNSIRYYTDVTNEEYAGIDNKLSETYTRIQNEACIALKKAMNSKHRDALRKHIDNDEFADALSEYEELTPRQLELVKLENELVQEYDSKYIEEYTYSCDGVDWTLSMLQESIDSGKLSNDKAMEIYGGIYKARNEVLAPIYPKLIALYNEEARLEGYSSYPEYAYSGVYNRDYSLEEIKVVYEAVKDVIVPLSNYLNENNYACGLDNMNLKGEERLELVGQVIPKIDPGLMDAWNYFTDNHLYNLDYSPTKMEVGFTTTLYSYGAPFIFDQPYQTWNDIETVVHEFGHFNQSYHTDRHALASMVNMDVAEIDSQGLELLSLEYAEDLFGWENAEDARIRVLTGIVDNIIGACIYDEFQTQAFEYEGELTVDVLNNMYKKISLEYGQDYQYGMETTWVEVTHTFESPMYYISYGTSALAALNIFAMAQEDRDAAIDCYMNLTSYGLETEYRELMNDVGLPDIFEEGIVEDITIAVDNYAQKTIDDMFIQIYIMYAIAALIVIAVICIVIVIIVRANKRKRIA